MSEPKWKDFDLSKLVERAEKADAPYLEFLRVPQLSCGIYTLPVGSTDNQSTHDEDEVYFHEGQTIDTQQIKHTR